MSSSFTGSENVQNRMTVLTVGGLSKSSPPSSDKNASSTLPIADSNSNTIGLQNSVSVYDDDDSVTRRTEMELEYEEEHNDGHNSINDRLIMPFKDDPKSNASLPLQQNGPLSCHDHNSSFKTSPLSHQSTGDFIWLSICFLGIMASFVCYGLLLEYTTSGGRKLHELSFLFVTSGLYTLTAAAGRYVRDEKPTTIPPARFAVLGVLSMGSTFCSVRSLRYVIYPIQVLAKSCKPVPVMIMGAFMGKNYPAKKYFNVFLIVLGVALFMGGGDKKKAHDNVDDSASPSQLIGILLLFISLCFDGGTGAYEDKLMSVHSVQPFDLMYNIQLGKTILAGIGLIVLNQMHIFILMVQDMGFLLVALGLSGALGQVFIFVTIAKFGALTCSIIGLARKVTTLVASIYFYGHSLNSIQFTGLVISVGSMVMNFWGKKKNKAGGDHGVSAPGKPEELEKMLNDDDEEAHSNCDESAVELVPSKTTGLN